MSTPIPAEPNRPSDRFLQNIPRDFARRHLLISGGETDEGELLFISERTPSAAVLNTGTRLGAAVLTQPRDDELLARHIDQAYASVTPDLPADLPAELADVSAAIEHLDRDLLSTDGKGPIARLLDALIFEAAGRDASDIHIQPLADRLLIRYRLDGALHTAHELSVDLARPLVSRVKVMGRMDIAERRLPQDGRTEVRIGRDRSVDIRISTLPTSYGERAVLRLLDTARGPGLADFRTLGMPRDTRCAFQRAASAASGIILVTGPTGSGKTTTLYTTLRWLAQGAAQDAAGDLNIMTIEDPIEYELSTIGLAISQAQVNARKGVNFTSGLRHLLRQDPDVIMIGEIRDTETARIAIQSSLTGHLVFSTLHTNDASSAVTRLHDLEVEPYLLAASLSAVLAQRLCRVRHDDCDGRGCPGCFGTGFRGRTAVFELLQICDELRELIGSAATTSELRAAARAGGMRTLADEGRALVSRGVTTQLELRRVLGEVA